jgi:hypothetical protein
MSPGEATGREPRSDSQFIDIAMPTAFVLEVQSEDGGWIDYGLYRPEMFGRLPDGSYVCAGHGGSPLFLRCLRQEGDVVDVVDGGGEPFAYRLCPFPSERYTEHA